MGINVVNIFLFAGAFIILAISAGFATNAAVRLGGNSDKDLQEAHKWLTRTAVIAWISVTLMVVGIILYFIFGLETAEATANIFVYALLFITLALVLIVGIFSAIAATNIGKSDADNKGAYRQAIIAAILGIVGFVLVAVIIGIKIFHKPSKEKSEAIDKKLNTHLATLLGQEVEDSPEVLEALM